MSDMPISKIYQRHKNNDLQILYINVKKNYFVLLFNVSRLGSRYNYNLYINYLIFSQKENYTVDERTNLAIT